MGRSFVTMTAEKLDMHFHNHFLKNDLFGLVNNVTEREDSFVLQKCVLINKNFCIDFSRDVHFFSLYIYIYIYIYIYKQPTVIYIYIYIYVY